MDILKLLENQINQFSNQTFSDFEKIKNHSIELGKFIRSPELIFLDYKNHGGCDCDFCQKMEPSISVNKKLQKRVRSLISDHIEENKYLKIDLSISSKCSKFSAENLHKHGFSKGKFNRHTADSYSLDLELYGAAYTYSKITEFPTDINAYFRNDKKFEELIYIDDISMLIDFVGVFYIYDDLFFRSSTSQMKQIESDIL
jgi:hypothetical protein